MNRLVKWIYRLFPIYSAVVLASAIAGFFYVRNENPPRFFAPNPDPAYSILGPTTRAVALVPAAAPLVEVRINGNKIIGHREAAQLWEFELSSRRNREDVMMSYSNSVVIVAISDGSFLGLSRERGEFLWAGKIVGFGLPEVIEWDYEAGRVYLAMRGAADKGFVAGIDAVSGKLAWNSEYRQFSYGPELLTCAGKVVVREALHRLVVFGNLSSQPSGKWELNDVIEKFRCEGTLVVVDLKDGGQQKIDISRSSD